MRGSRLLVFVVFTASFVGIGLWLCGSARADGPALSDPCEVTAPMVDFDGSAWIDFRDFSFLALSWRDADAMTDVAPAPSGDGVVDLRDLAALAKHWLQRAELPIYITWLGHASVKVVWADQVIYVDPVDIVTSPRDATLILITHSHSDHYEPTSIDRVSGPAAQIIAPPGVATTYPRRQSIAPGQTIDLPGMQIIGVASYNINKTNHPKANNWVGFIVQIGSRRIYCAGDTDLTPELKALTDIDVAFLPAGGTYTMTAAEAAEATKYFMPRLAIPYHWGRSVGTLADAELFARNAACNARVMTKGQTIHSDDWDKDLSILAHWKLDETTGDIAHDSAGANHGMLQGGPLWQPTGGRLGGALELDGVDDYVLAPFLVNPSAGSFSVFAWIKGGAPGEVILSQVNGANWLMADPATGALRTELRTPPVTGGRFPTPAGPPLIGATVITDGNWHHVGFVRDGTARILYVDGVEAARDTAASLEPATAGLRLGAGSTLAPATFYSGLIDDLRLHTRTVQP